jgi:deoxyhypusine monooxygenase
MILVRECGELLSDTTVPLKLRFRGLFALKNLGGAEAISWISKNFSDQSALLKHELAYCLGQMTDVGAIPILESLLSSNQEVIVRHEAGQLVDLHVRTVCLI